MRQIAAIRRCDTSPRLYCCCDKALSLSLSLRYVARIQTSLNSCDRSQRQNSVAATMVFTCHTRRFVAAICRGDVSQRFVASCVSALLFPGNVFSQNVVAKYCVMFFVSAKELKERGFKFFKLLVQILFGILKLTTLLLLRIFNKFSIVIFVFFLF